MKKEIIERFPTYISIYQLTGEFNYVIQFINSVASKQISMF